MMTNVMGIWAFLTRETSFSCPTSVVYYYFKKSPFLHSCGRQKEVKKAEDFDRRIQPFFIRMG